MSLFLIPYRLLAWGGVGHRTVAYIAQDYLSPRAKSAVREILGPGENLVSVCTWADTIAHVRLETAPWHYIQVNVREDQNRYDLSEACRNHDCVVDQIKKDIGILEEAFVSKKEKREALKFLVHFVGDVHQPLHCAEDKDRGGNEKWFRYFPKEGSQRYTWVNLHSFWDNLLESKAKENPRRLASQLEKEISTEDAKNWSRGNATDWAYESFSIARNSIYSELPEGPLLEKNHWGLSLPQDYYSGAMRKIVDQQLEKAGVRLAYLINNVFGN